MLQAFLDTYAHPDWRIAHRLWSIRIALFWAAVSGLWMALPAFQGVLPPTRFAGACVGVALLLCIGRLTKQRGLV